MFKEVHYHIGRESRACLGHMLTGSRVRQTGCSLRVAFWDQEDSSKRRESLRLHLLPPAGDKFLYSSCRLSATLVRSALQGSLKSFWVPLMTRMDEPPQTIAVSSPTISRAGSVIHIERLEARSFGCIVGTGWLAYSLLICLTTFITQLCYWSS